MASLNRAFLWLLLTVTIPHASKADWAWTPTANCMSDQRWAPSYTVLADGKTGLIAGGYSFARQRCVASADLYDSSTHRFVPLSSRLNTPRDFGTATPLPDGTVLIAGGFNDVLGSLNVAEIFNPATKRFSLLPQHMLCPRELHTATLLNDGTVLIAGGLNLWEGRTQSSAEIYAPTTRTFTSTAGPMGADRFGQTSCLLANGKVLIAGGTSVVFGRGGYANVLASAEIFDPATRLFTKIPEPMSIGRDRPTASLVPDGRVLIAGGQGPGGKSIDYSEIFDPRSCTFSRLPTNQITVRMAHCAGTLPDRRLILTGGWSAPAKATTAAVEEFDPVTMTYLPESALPFSSHDAALLIFPSGETLAAGGKSVASDGAATAISGGAWAMPD